MKKIFLPLILVGGLLAGCATNPTTGDYQVGSVDLGFGSGQVKIAQADVQAAVNALPSLCKDFAAASALTQAEIAVLQTGGLNLPSRTVTNISNASAKGLLICNGTAAVLVPAVNAAQ